MDPQKEEKDTKMESREPTREEVEKRLHEIHLQYEPSFATGIDGIKFDFCHGLRMMVPPTAKERHVLEIWDDESGTLLGRHNLKPNDYLRHPVTYFKRFMIRLLDASGEKPQFQHTLDLKDKPVVISFPQRTVGDSIAWFSPVVDFTVNHRCKTYVAMHPHIRAMFEGANPEVTFITFEQMEMMRPYAHYLMGVNFDGAEDLMPWDWRHQGLHHVGYRILGMDSYEADDNPPKLAYDHGKCEIAEPYVCIGSMASGGGKLWLNPTGWNEVCIFLKKCGYRVIDIDALPYMQFGYMAYYIPREAEDFTGHGEGRTLPDRAAIINHADFFIGLGSGLSWLAWAVRKPVVLISGFSLPFCEFHTPYRVINTNVCHGCFNDTSLRFNGKDPFWCPRQTEAKNKMGCSLSITSTQVINSILTMPEFQEHMEQAGLEVIKTPNGYDVQKISDSTENSNEVK